MSKYKEIMDRVELTDEMRERVLKNVKESVSEKKSDSSAETAKKAEVSKKPSITPVKKNQRIAIGRYISIAAACLIVAGGILLVWSIVGNNRLDRRSGETTVLGSTPSTTDDVLAHGPLNSDRKDLDDIGGINSELGLNLSDLKDLPFVPSQKTYSVYGHMAEISYNAGLEEECIWRISSNAEDVTALAENFSSSKDLVLPDGAKAKLYGEEDGFYLAVFSKAGKTSSVQFVSATDDDTFRKVIAEISGML